MEHRREHNERDDGDDVEASVRALCRKAKKPSKKPSGKPSVRRDKLSAMDSCYVVKSPMDRWIVVKADDCNLAWSGSRWVPHAQGLPTGNVQVSNFSSWADAAQYAKDYNLNVITYRISSDGITCIVCNRTSSNPNDIKDKYCGFCHRFHEAMAL